MAAFSTLAAIGLGAAGLYGASKSASAAKESGQLQAQAADAATAEQRRQFDITQGLYKPIYDEGRAAAKVYNTALGIPSMTGSNVTGSTSGGTDWAAYVSSFPDLANEFQNYAGQFSNDPAIYGQWHYQNFGQKEGRVLPSMTTGAGAQPDTSTQAGIVSMVQNTPGYQTQLSEGLKAIDRAAPLRGGMYSGRRMKALEGEGQKTFGNFYQNYLDRVSRVAGTGSDAASSLSSAGQATANNVGNLMTQSAQAKGNAATNSAAAWNSGISSVAGAVGMGGAAKGWW